MEPDTRNLKDEIKKAGLRLPKVLTLMITEACNLKCPHCLLNCKNADADPVRKDTILDIIDEFRDLGGDTLLVTGGEPLLHPDWYEILCHACHSKGLLEVVLQTNGAMVRAEDIKKIKTLSREKITIQISLDGATPETNDLIRGKGGFEAAVNAVRGFVGAGMGERIKIAFTEMRHNYNEIPAMLKLTDDLGAGLFTAGTLVKGGRAENAEWIELPDRAQVRELIKLYETDHKFRELYDKLGNISVIEWYKGRNIPADHVCNCISTPFIDAFGKMYPCVMNLSDDLAVDNVHEEGLNNVIIKGIDKWSRLPEIDKKRSGILAECQECAGREHCRGGCMGRAWAVSGDAMSVEDRCELRREVYYFDKKHE